MQNKILSVLFVVLIAAPAVAYQPYQSANSYATQQATLKGAVFTIPAGASIPAIVTSELNTQTLFLGQAVTCLLPQDYYYNNKLIAPAGSVINGTVINLKKASFAGRNGQLKIKFTSIVSPYGQMIPISGQIKTTDGTDALKAATTKDTTSYTKDAVAGAASGAVGGVVMGAISGGNIGKSAALGTAIGSGVGVSKSMFDKGGDIIIPSNTNIAIQLDQPITVNSTSAYRY